MEPYSNEDTFTIFDEAIDIAQNHLVNNPSINMHRTITREEIEKTILSLPQTFPPSQIEYLPITDWSYLIDDNIITIENKFFTYVNNNLNKEQYSSLLKKVTNSDINYIHNHPDHIYNVSPLNSIEHLIEETFFYDNDKQLEMLSHYLKLENNVYKWRHIKGDGNCFYRAVMFAFMENIIITKNLFLLKLF